VGRSTRTIERMRQSLDLFGTPYLPKVNSPGRPRALAKSQVDWLVDYLNDKPTAYFDELALTIYDEFGIDVHPSTVGLVLKRRNWTRKAVKERALQQSAVLRAIWIAKMANWQPEQLVFVDESAACERTGARKRGWSPKGVSCSVLRTVKRSERWSILPALTTEGYLPDPLIIQGGVNKETFT